MTLIIYSDRADFPLQNKKKKFLISVTIFLVYQVLASIQVRLKLDRNVQMVKIYLYTNFNMGNLKI